MAYGEECIIWNNLSHMRLTSRSHHMELTARGTGNYSKLISFIMFLPHTMDEPDFLGLYNYHLVVSNDSGRYFVADNLKDYDDEEIQQSSEQTA